MKQQSFSSLEQAHKKKRTKREVFLGEMDAVVPWARLEALIAPHYSKPSRGRPQMPLSVMLRIYFLQQWYGLSDPGAEEALYDMHSMRDVAFNLAQAQVRLFPEKRECRSFQPCPCSRPVLDQSLPGGFHPLEIMKHFALGFVGFQL